MSSSWRNIAQIHCRDFFTRDLPNAPSFCQSNWSSISPDLRRMSLPASLPFSLVFPASSQVPSFQKKFFCTKENYLHLLPKSRPPLSFLNPPPYTSGVNKQIATLKHRSRETVSTTDLGWVAACPKVASAILLAVSRSVAVTMRRRVWTSAVSSKGLGCNLLGSPALLLGSWNLRIGMFELIKLPFFPHNKWCENHLSAFVWILMKFSFW